MLCLLYPIAGVPQETQGNAALVHLAQAPADDGVPDDEKDPEDLLGLRGYVEAAENELDRRDCVAKCREQYGASYPCEQQCTLDLCLKRAGETADWRFMPPGVIPPECLTHRQVLEQAVKEYRERQFNLETKNIWDLIASARQHARAAQDLINQALQVWTLVEGADKTAIWAVGEVQAAERIVSEARNACTQAPTLAEMAAAAKATVAEADFARERLAGTRSFTDEACRIATLIAPDDRDPYRTNRQQKVDSLTSNARDLAGMAERAADRAASKVAQILAMEERRLDARRKWETARNAIDPAIVTANYALSEISGVLARADAYAALLDKAEQHAAEAARLRKRALELIDRLHQRSMSRFTSEQERTLLAETVGPLLEACKNIEIPSPDSARKTVAESRERIEAAASKVRQALERANGLEAMLAACASLAGPMGDVVREAQGAADAARRSQQEAQALVAAAERCIVKPTPEPSAADADLVTVPTVKGLSHAVAAGVIRQARLVPAGPVLGDPAPDGVAPGAVQGTAPAWGTKLPPSSEVTIIVYAPGRTETATPPADTAPDCATLYPGSRATYVPSMNATLCLCPDGRLADAPGGCGEVQDPLCAGMENRLAGARDAQTAQAIVNEAQALHCPVSEAAVNRWNANHAMKCEGYAQRLWATRDLNTARAILQEASALGCNLQRTVSAWDDRRQQESGQRAQQQQQQLQQFQTLMQGLGQMMQGMPGVRPPGATMPPSRPPGPTVAPPPASPPQQTRPPASPASPTRCQQVCVQEQVRWFNLSDGRHSLCAGGVARPPGPGLAPPRCQRSVQCVKWETRCR
jgi:tetratricopeptide (TPR) repeat protein